MNKFELEIENKIKEALGVKETRSFNIWNSNIFFGRYYEARPIYITKDRELEFNDVDSCFWDKTFSIELVNYKYENNCFYLLYNLTINNVEFEYEYKWNLEGVEPIIKNHYGDFQIFVAYILNKLIKKWNAYPYKTIEECKCNLGSKEEFIQVRKIERDLYKVFNSKNIYCLLYGIEFVDDYEKYYF